MKLNSYNIKIIKFYNKLKLIKPWKVLNIQLNIKSIKNELTILFGRFNTKGIRIATFIINTIQ
jgi:hypothetical protein